MDSKILIAYFSRPGNNYVNASIVDLMSEVVVMPYKYDRLREAILIVH